MANIVIKDLGENRELDKKALASVIGGALANIGNYYFYTNPYNAAHIDANNRAIASDPWRWYQGAVYAQNVYRPYLNSINSFGGLMAEADRMIAFGRSLGLGG